MEHDLSLPGPPARRKASLVKMVLRLALLLLLVQTVTWVFVGRRSLVRGFPRMAQGDLLYLRDYGADRELLNRGNLPQRKYFITMQLARRLGRGGLEELEKLITGFNGRLNVTPDSAHLMLMIRGDCRDCLILGYRQAWNTPLLAKAYTVYQKPAAPGPHDRFSGGAWPTPQRERVYAWCLVGWVEIRERWTVNTAGEA